MNKKVFIILILIIIHSCTVTHNIPNNQTPNEPISEKSYKVFVDQNGDFYPDDWEKTYGEHPKNAAGRKGAYSLNILAKRQNLTKNLTSFKSETLKEIKEKFVNSKRIYILIHGFNNSQSKADSSFTSIQNKINFQPNEGVIKFYWDGLVADGPIESFDIWFNATGYSQLAGERALRPIINLFDHKEIILISHSRGGSVLLSALSDPPYDKDFAEDTFKFHDIKVHNQPKLYENNNIINAILLAPALGQVDFREPDYNKRNMTPFRNFSNQVNNIHITVNKDDKILKKYIKVLSSKANPTDLGYNINVFNLLKKSYPKMSMSNFNGLNSHSFIDYVNDSKFLRILENFDIKTK